MPKPSTDKVYLSGRLLTNLNLKALSCQCFLHLSPCDFGRQTNQELEFYPFTSIPLYSWLLLSTIRCKPHRLLSITLYSGCTYGQS